MVGVLFAFLVAVMTYPLVFNLTKFIPGFFSTDESYAGLWDFWKIKYLFLNHLPVNHTNLIAYPFGVDLSPFGLTNYVWPGINFILSVSTNPALTWNLQVLINYLFCGLAAYVLALYLFKSRLASFFSGIIFCFCPYQFIRSWQHLGLTYNQWLPLSLFAVIFLKDKPSKKSIALLFLSLFALFTFDYSITYIGVIALSAFFIYLFGHSLLISKFKIVKVLKEQALYLKNIGIAVFFCLVLVSPGLYVIAKNRLSLSNTTAASAHNAYHRPFEDLFAQSARPLSYILPSSTHPLLGKFTEQMVGSSWYGVSFTEHTLYLGWIPLLFAFMAFKSLKKQKRKEDILYVGLFLFIALVAWLFSQPPWWQIGSLKIYMPSFFMYKLLPMYRAYCRFGILLMLAVAVLAGFGLKLLLERFKSQKVKVAITILFSGLVLFEFWNWPPYKVIDVSKVPAVYYWVKNQPGDLVIAEYPMDYSTPNDMYKFYQTKHEKKLINGTVPFTYANRVADSIKKLSDPKTASVLKWMGVKYVIVHRNEYLNTELSSEKEELKNISKNKSLKLVQSFPAQDCLDNDIMCVQKTGPIDVYSLVADPIKPAVKE